MEERAQLALENILRHLSQGEIPAAADTLEDLHPADGADVLMELGTRQQEQILSVTSAQAVARILEHLSDADTVQVSHRIQANILPQVLDNMEADKAADLLNELPPDQASSILSRMVGAANVASLLLHPEDSAGGIMSLQFVVFEEDITTQQAIDYLRRVRPSSERVYYLFVRDPGNHLTGVLSLRQLVIASPGEKVRDIMNTEVISVPAGTDREACARLMEHYNLSALPVVDEERRLVGVITLEEVVDVIEEEATEDMYRMVGLPDEERVGSPFLFSVKKRLPWLYINLGT
ncbi:MAG: magnesium transporter, partial [Dehalococcoidia bacterium]|nr:magnesium transporter [Dehalococcoidia bacterium]